MIVCVCKGLSDKDLEEHVKDCPSIEDLVKIIGIGTECGSCVKFIKEKFKEKGNG